MSESRERRNRNIYRGRERERERERENTKIKVGDERDYKSPRREPVAVVPRQSEHGREQNRYVLNSTQDDPVLPSEIQYEVEGQHDEKCPQIDQCT